MELYYICNLNEQKMKTLNNINIIAGYEGGAYENTRTVRLVLM